MTSTENTRRFRAAHPGYDAAKRQEHKVEYREAARKSWSKRLYGMTPDEIRAMFGEVSRRIEALRI